MIGETLQKCGAVVLLIGRHWIERNESSPPFGDPKDVITQEVQSTLDLKIPIVPVLVDRASMPGGSVLPEQFQGFPASTRWSFAIRPSIATCKP